MLHGKRKLQYEIRAADKSHQLIQFDISRESLFWFGRLLGASLAGEGSFVGGVLCTFETACRDHESTIQPFLYTMGARERPMPSGQTRPAATIGVLPSSSGRLDLLTHQNGGNIFSFSGISKALTCQEQLVFQSQAVSRFRMVFPLETIHK